MKNYTAIVDNIDSIKKLLEENKKIITVYSLNIDVYNYFKKKKYDNVEVLDILKINRDYSQRKVIAKLRTIEKDININLINKVENFELENINNIFHVAASSAYNLYFNIKKNYPFLVYHNNKWIYTTDINFVFNFFYKKNILKLRSMLNLEKNKHQKFPNIIKLLNTALFFFLRKKNFVLFSTDSYNFRNLINKLKFLDKHTKTLILSSSHHLSFIKLLITYVKYFIFFKKKEIHFIIPRDISIKKFYFQKIYLKNFDSILHIVQSEIFDLINDSVNYVRSIEKNSHQLLTLSKPKLFITHHIKWFENLVISKNLNLLKIPVYLISHGSTPLNSQITASYELEKNADGLVVSKFANASIAHSPISERAILKYMPNLKIIRVKFWENSKTYKKNNSFKTILHAGTAKPLGIRSWIYENQEEYLNNLLKLSETIIDMKNIILIIRIRKNIGCSIDTIRNILPIHKNIIIKLGGDFNNDLINADLLISCSSTTIEQAISANVPVALLSSNDRFFHIEVENNFPDFKRSFPVYKLEYNNLKLSLSKIIDMHNNKKCREEDIFKLKWNDNEALDLNSFIKKILKN